jgi:RimJ/RimL family protein N-acetyltransferase
MDDPAYRFESPRSLFPARIETERLELTQLSGDAVGPRELYEHLGRGDTIGEETRHVNWEPHDTPMTTKRAIDHFEEAWRSGEKAVYVVRPTGGEDADAFAGTATLTVEWDRRLAELGIYLRKRFWGRGYASERAKALVHLAFERLDLEVVEVNCSVGNDRARRAIEKYVDDLGGEYVGRRYNMVAAESGDTFDCHLYTVTREQYRA